MYTSPRPWWRTALVGVTLGVLMVLFAAPPTGWLARKQFAGVGFTLPRTDAQKGAETTARRLRAAQRFPNDIDVQIAAALYEAGTHYSSTGTDIHTIQQDDLSALRPRFGDRPALYATLMHYAMTGDDPNRVQVARPDENLLLSHPPASQTVTPATPPDPSVLAAFDAEAVAGERLDPQNAFFPFMRAVGLFAAHRDTAGIDALLRAGRAPLWNEYTQDETNGFFRLAEAADGPQSVLDRIGITASVMYPQFTQLRAVARLATVKAMQDEQTGNVAQGLAIRRAVMSVGDRMRVQSPSLIGSLTGMAVATIATSRPGGAAPFTQDPPPGLTDAQRRHWWDARFVERFAAYAIHAGHSEDAALARAQMAADEAERAVWAKAEPKELYNRIALHTDLWIADEVTLAVIFWLLTLGGAARVLSRRTAFREARPLPRSVSWGIAIAVLLGMAVVVYNATADVELQASVVQGNIIAVVVGPGALFLMRRHLTRHTIARSARAFCVTALVVGAAAALADVLTHDARDMAVALVQSHISDATGIIISEDYVKDYVRIVIVAATLAVPLLLLCVFTLAGRARRVPVNVAVVRGFLSSAVPVACVLFLVWSGLCLATLRQERQMDAELNQMRTHEGRYLALLAGVPWPGPVVH